jgi:hypothetical protein
MGRQYAFWTLENESLTRQNESSAQKNESLARPLSIFGKSPEKTGEVIYK